MKHAYIIDAARSPIGKYGGTLASVRPDDLLADVLIGLVNRNPSIDFSELEDVIIGAANQAGEDNRNVARMSSLMAGLPIQAGGNTVNRLCASGLQAIMDASRAVECNEGELFIAGGVESMTRAPFVIGKGEQPYDRSQTMYDTTMGWRFINKRLSEMYHPHTMGETAENVANQYSISREEQDLFALSSQEKYAQAHQNSKFHDEIIPIIIKKKKADDVIFDKDEHPRLSDINALAGLKPAFVKGGSVTAGNSSGINDGAAALIIASEDVVNKYNLKPMAKVVSRAVAGVDPAVMGIGPIPAIQKALKRAQLTIEDIDLFELNEAFASQSLAIIKELKIDASKVNVNGGAIALGHPLGCSGARISTTLLHEMKKRDVRFGLATMCIGVGQGAAVIFEKI